MLSREEHENESNYKIIEQEGERILQSLDKIGLVLINSVMNSVYHQALKKTVIEINKKIFSKMLNDFGISKEELSNGINNCKTKGVLLKVFF